jgi:hypothetical protein
MNAKTNAARTALEATKRRLSEQVEWEVESLHSSMSRGMQAAQSLARLQQELAEVQAGIDGLEGLAQESNRGVTMDGMSNRPATNDGQGPVPRHG